MRTLLGLSILVILLNACSQQGTEQGKVSVPPSADTSGTTSPQNPFDSSTLNSGLFDRNTGSDSKPTVTPQPIAYKESDLYCLSRDSGLFSTTPLGGTGLRGGFANEVSSEAVTEPQGNVSTSRLGCLAPRGPSFGQDFFLDEALLSMGGMQSCFQFVANRQPAANAAIDEIQAHFAGAKRALVRCYRRVLARQVQIAQWSNPTMNRFDQVDSHLFLLLSLFSQQ